MKDAVRYINHARISDDPDSYAETVWELFKDRLTGIRDVAVPLRLIEGFPDDSMELRPGKGMLFEDGSAVIMFYDNDGNASENGGVMLLDLDKPSDRLTLQTIVHVSRIMYRDQGEQS